MRRIRLAAAVLLVAAALATAGCTAAKPGVDIELTVNPDGTIEQSVAVRGVDLTPNDVKAMQVDKWSVRAGSSQSNLSRRFSNLNDFGANNRVMTQTLYSALTSTLNRDLPTVDPQVLTVSTSDLLVAKRYTATYELPTLNLKPTKCSSCDGTGRVECYACSGQGDTDCSVCSGTGRDYYGWDCSYCENGKVTCSSCNGSGKVDCSACNGSGGPSEEELSAYNDTVSKVRMSVALNMPGIAAKGQGSDSGTSWEYESEDALAGVKVSATSWVVDWLTAGIVAAILLLLLILAVYLIVRSIKGAFARRTPKPSAPALAVTGAPAAIPGGGAKFCPECGKSNSGAATFCSGCGTRIG